MIDINKNKLNDMLKSGYKFMGEDVWSIDDEATLKYCTNCGNKDCYRHAIIKKSTGSAGYCSYFINFNEPDRLAFLILDKELFTL